MERSYRRAMHPSDLVSFRVAVGETDLWVAAGAEIGSLVKERVLHHRRVLKTYLGRDPGFAAALVPRAALPGAPPLIRRMLDAGAAAGVGPMAAVAGAIAQAVGEDLRMDSPEIILENGGDIYLRSTHRRIVSILAGDSTLSGTVGLALSPCPDGLGVCTSAGTVGPSLSLGRADAAVIVAPDVALADAAATALGNRIHRANDLERAVAWAAGLPGVLGAVAVLGDRLAAAGKVELVPIDPGFRS